ncbi:MAG TPA: YceI family protein [Pyrinomonadaceae bacterium]|nr:YceI family protein [Pyrinomonadaceae bacterium]
MRRYLTTFNLMIIAALTYNCADPAANKTKATVTNAAPEANSSKPLGAERLVISPGNSKVEFVAAKVTRSHNGSFKQFAGTIDFAPNDVDNSLVTIDIATASVVTDEPDLTAHLKTPDFFDVAKYPKATFVSTKITPDESSGTQTVTGNFDLHGVKKSITFPATIHVTPESVTVDAEFSINRKDFGIVFAGKADDLIRDGVVIKLTIKAPRTK